MNDFTKNNEQAQSDYAAAEKREADYQAWKRTPGYKECFQTGRERAAADLYEVWRHIGIEGVVCPTHVMSYAERLVYDDDLGVRIDALALAGDTAEVGRIISEQLDEYFNESAEEFCRENWREWQ